MARARSSLPGSRSRGSQAAIAPSTRQPIVKVRLQRLSPAAQLNVGGWDLCDDGQFGPVAPTQRFLCVGRAGLEPATQGL